MLSSLLTLPNTFRTRLREVRHGEFALRMLLAGTVLGLTNTSCSLPEGDFTSSNEPPITIRKASTDTIYSSNLDASLFPSDAASLESFSDEIPDAGQNTGLRPKFGMTAAVTSDDNLFLDAENPVSDVEFTVSPQVSIGLGDTRDQVEDYLALDYKPTAHVFVENTDENAVDHDAAVRGQYRLGKLKTKAETRFQSLSGANREVGSRVDQKALQGNVEGAYELSGKTSLGARVGFRNDTYDEPGLANSSEQYAEGFADYALTGKTTLGVGGRAGRIDTDGAAKQDYTQGFIRGESKIGGKVSLSARAGVDSREVDGENEITPVLEAALDYKPRDGTSIKVGAYRSLNPSTLNPGDSYTRTGVSASVKQKLGSKFYMKLDGGVERADYKGSTGTGAARKDNYFYVRPAVGYEFKEGLSAELYYRHSTNDSSQQEFGYEANQVGASMNLQY
jgi:hypothetical protein